MRKFTAGTDDVGQAPYSEDEPELRLRETQRKLALDYIPFRLEKTQWSIVTRGIQVEIFIPIMMQSEAKQ